MSETHITRDIRDVTSAEAVGLTWTQERAQQQQQSRLLVHSDADSSVH